MWEVGSIGLEERPSSISTEAKDHVRGWAEDALMLTSSGRGTLCRQPRACESSPSSSSFMDL